MYDDYSKSAVADRRLFLALMAIGKKGRSTLWLNPSMLPSLGSVGIQLGTFNGPGNGIPALCAINS
jgi:hypothetical protein